MNKEDLAIRLIEMLLGTTDTTIGNEIKGEIDTKTKPLIGEYVIVRCRDAGVHSGILVDYQGRNVELKESRRLWYFQCKTGHSLSGVALHGITDESKIAGQLPSLILSDACEIIPTTADAERSIRDAEEYRN